MAAAEFESANAAMKAVSVRAFAFAFAFAFTFCARRFGALPLERVHRCERYRCTEADEDASDPPPPL